MQSSARILTLGGLIAVVMLSNTASAQLFGNRGAQPNPFPNMGMPNNPAAGAGATISGSQMTMGISRPEQGVDRFLRQNRSPRDFVGRSRADMSTFIGAQQALAVGQVRSATEGLRLDASNARRINRPIPPQPNKGLYYPKLELDLDTDDDRDDENAMVEVVEPIQEADTRMMERLHRVGGPAVQIALAGTTATLSGQVDSKRKSELVEQLLSFEPGIDKVVNLLDIANRGR